MEKMNVFKVTYYDINNKSRHYYLLGYNDTKTIVTKGIVIASSVKEVDRLNLKELKSKSSFNIVAVDYNDTIERIPYKKLPKQIKERVNLVNKKVESLLFSYLEYSIDDFKSRKRVLRDEYKTYVRYIAEREEKILEYKKSLDIVKQKIQNTINKNIEKNKLKNTDDEFINNLYKVTYKYRDYKDTISEYTTDIGSFSERINDAKERIKILNKEIRKIKNRINQINFKEIIKTLYSFDFIKDISIRDIGFSLSIVFKVKDRTYIAEFEKNIGTPLVYLYNEKTNTKYLIRVNGNDRYNSSYASSFIKNGSICYGSAQSIADIITNSGDLIQEMLLLEEMLSKKQDEDASPYMPKRTFSRYYNLSQKDEAYVVKYNIFNNGGIIYGRYNKKGNFILQVE